MMEHSQSRQEQGQAPTRRWAATRLGLGSQPGGGLAMRSSLFARYHGMCGRWIADSHGYRQWCTHVVARVAVLLVALVLVACARGGSPGADSGEGPAPLPPTAPRIPTAAAAPSPTVVAEP